VIQDDNYLGQTYAATSVAVVRVCPVIARLPRCDRYHRGPDDALHAWELRYAGQIAWWQRLLGGRRGRLVV